MVQNKNRENNRKVSSKDPSGNTDFTNNPQNVCLNKLYCQKCITGSVEMYALFINVKICNEKFVFK